MLTGDAKAVAKAVATDLGIDTVFAEVLPGERVDKIKELKAQGKRVAMAGDGVNDAPALLTADVTVAIGAGTHVAVEAGAVVLVRSDPRDVPRIIALSRANYRKMMQNLWWAARLTIRRRAGSRKRRQFRSNSRPFPSGTPFSCPARRTNLHASFRLATVFVWGSTSLGQATLQPAL
jgi:hypothetical protein